MSFDEITRRATLRMCEGKTLRQISRIREKARDHRAHRAAMMFLTALRYPVPLGHALPGSGRGL